jgi:hypothetical protein
VQVHLSGKEMREIAKELGLPNHWYVSRWVRAFEEKGPKGLEDHRGKHMGIAIGKFSSKKPELRIKWLEAEVAL